LIVTAGQREVTAQAQSNAIGQIGQGAVNANLNASLEGSTAKVMAQAAQQGAANLS
jgi:hypothetical protein